MYLDDNILLEILQDTNLKGKEINWKNRKINNSIIAKSFKRLKKLNRANRLEDCGTLLKFAECEKDNYKKLVKANFCHDRLCPICNWRKSVLLQYQLKQMIIELKKQQNVEFVFLTLTSSNVDGKDLSKNLDSMYKAFNRFFKYKKLNDMSVGYIRTLEVTRNTNKNSKDYNTYHAHFHVLIAVKPSYFRDKTYIRQSDFVNLWKKALKVNYNPIVHIEKVKPKSKKQSLMSAILEVAKYSVKDTDYICDTDKETDAVVKTLSGALKGRRLIGFSKVFKEIRANLKLQDVEDDNTDLINHNDKECHCPKCGNILNNVVYGWKDTYKNYFKLDISVDEIENLFCNSYLYKFRKKRLIKPKEEPARMKNVVDKKNIVLLSKSFDFDLVSSIQKKSDKFYQLTLNDLGFI